METFNTTRFLQLCKWSIQTYKKEFLRITTGISIAFFIVLFVSLNFENSIYMTDEMTEYAAFKCITIMFFILSIMPSYIFNNMNTKQQRLMYKLLPASNLEKFISRALYVTLFITIGTALAFCVADVVRYSLALITGKGVQALATPDFFKGLCDILPKCLKGDIREWILTAEGFLWGQSLYILGGTIFRRHQFIFTSIALILGTIAISWLLAMTGDMFQLGLNYMREPVKIMVYCAMCVLPVLTIANYYISYVIFKRMQVINNKWINL